MTCGKCLNNVFKHSKKEGWVTSECQMCPNIIVWKPKANRLKCGCGEIPKLTPLKFKPSKLRKKYYYTHAWKCSCKKIYYDNTYKVINEE